MSANFEKTESHVAQSLKEHPDSTKAFNNELHNMRHSETPAAFKQDMTKLNEDLHKQGLLPGLQIVENKDHHRGSKYDEFKLQKIDGANNQSAVESHDQSRHGGGDRQSTIEGAQKTLADPKASAADKLSTVENLSKNGIKNIQVADSDGKMRDYSIETNKSGNREMVHLYGKDDSGQNRIALRGVDNGNGTFSQEKDKNGHNTDYQGNNWGAAGTGKSNVGVVSDGQKGVHKDLESTPARPESAPVRPDSTPARAAQPADGTTPEKPIAPAAPERGPGSIDRSQFDSQLKDPKVMAAFAGRMDSEVGSQGRAAQTAFAEEIMNRAAARNQTVMQALSGDYYKHHDPGSSTNPKYVEAITNAWKNGTDTIHGATGNASKHVGFGVKGGHYDAQHNWVSPNQTANIAGERYGYEQQDLSRDWMKKYESLKQYS